MIYLGNPLAITRVFNLKLSSITSPELISADIPKFTNVEVDGLSASTMIVTLALLPEGTMIVESSGRISLSAFEVLSSD